MANTQNPQPPAPQPASTPQLAAPLVPPPPPPQKLCIQPSPGESITSALTNNTYTIGTKLGEGSFGIVYSCKDVWENDLAAKVLKPVGTYDKVKASFQAEFLKLLALRHPNITYIYDAFECRDTFYIITEKCEGPVGGAFALPGFNTAVLLMPIARCLLQAVHYLHLNSIVHQDIHPGNVFASVVKDELQRPSTTIQFKLGDLGIAKVLTEVGVHNTRALWMQPPEFLKPADFGPLDHRIDLYHVGLLLLQIALSTALSFTEAEILAGKPRDMAQTLPPPLNFALEKTLRRHAAFRTSSAMELWRDLHAVPSALPPPTAAAVLPPPPPPVPPLPIPAPPSP
jgi:serine/threonine-protein kinase